MPPGRRRKYYVVTAGKCTGVFDNWCVFDAIFSVAEMLETLNRLYVHSLTSGVSGSCQESFKTYDEALYLYTDAKRRGIVRLVRDPGDEEIFGPVEDAMQ
jgi:hypothetical protein